MIIFALTLAGEIMSECLKKRLIVLRQMNRFLETAEILIKSKALTYEDIIFEVYDDDKFSELVFLKIIKENILNGETDIRNLWEESVKKSSPYYMKKDDTDIFLDIGNTLGAYDTESEIKSLDGIKEILKLSVNDAENDYKEKGKIYRILGVTSGLLTAIIFV